MALLTIPTVTIRHPAASNGAGHWRQKTFMTTLHHLYKICRRDGLPAWRALDMARVWLSNINYFNQE